MVALLRQRLDRLRRLEQRIGVDRDCPACRDRRGRAALTESQRLPDGTTVREGDWPALCSRCGKVAEFIIEVIRPCAPHEQPAN